MSAANDNAIELRLGDWRDVLQDVECDALICDPPYSARTDAGYRSAMDFERISAEDRVARVRKTQDSIKRGRLRSSGPIPKSRFELPYAPVTEDWVREFVSTWLPRVRDWFVVFGDHVSNRWFESAFADAGLVTFAPVPWVRTNSAPRFNADGPANSCEWIAMARPKGLPTVRASRPGYYLGVIDTRTDGSADRIVTGGKPLWLMSALIRDYSRPGDLICDPCAGGGTTLLAAAIEGRRAIGAELDPNTYRKAQARIARGYTPVMRFTDREPAEQQSLLEKLADV